MTLYHPPILMKRLLKLLLLFVIAAMLPLGCSGSSQNSPATPVSQEKVLNIYNYSTYIAADVIAQFEKQYGVKIKYDNYETSDALYAKLKPGNPGYDLIFPADYMVRIMSLENMLEPLDLKKIPNHKNLEPKFVNQPFDPGNKYSLPYQWGTMGIGYNFKAIPEKVDSWGVLFDPKFKGKIAWLDDARYGLAAALLSLGYDPNTTNPDEINQARDLIINHKDLISVFAPDTGQTLLDRGEVNMTIEWSGDMFQVMKENPNLRYVIPKEGTIVFSDNMAIPKGAKNKELAEQFINFVLEPKIGATISNFIHYGSPNKAAIAQGLIDPNDLKNPAIYPPAKVFTKLKYIYDVGKSTTLYDQAWNEIKVAAGK